MNSDQAQQFADRLGAMAGEDRRADRAVVKRARTGHPTQRLLARRVYHQLIPDGVPHTERNVGLVERVAGLFVVNPVPSGSGAGVGTAARELAVRSGVGADAVERRFCAVLAAGPDTIDTHLARLFARFAADGIGIDYGRLTQDLSQVGHPARFVQRRWADQFWGGTAPAGGNEPTGEKTQ